MTVDPALFCKVTVLPLMVAMVRSLLEYVTGSPELAVAPRANGGSVRAFEGKAEKVMV